MILLAATCAACRSKPHEQAGASAPPSPAAASATASAPSATSANPAAFDPEGYYFPAETLVVKGFQLEHMALDRTSASLHFDPGPGDPEGPSVVCNVGAITADTLRLTCVGERVGRIVLAGTFLDKRGSFADQPEIKPQETVVLQATLTFEGKTAPESRLVHFTYWQGD